MSYLFKECVNFNDIISWDASEVTKIYNIKGG